jgi:two-component system cell cycle response regulator
MITSVTQGGVIMADPLPTSISRWRGEFDDVLFEGAYFSEEIRSTSNYIRPVTLIMGFLYLLFAIPDFFVMTDRRLFLIFLLSRILFFGLCVYLSNKLPRIENHQLFCRLISISEFVFILLFLATCFLYQPLNLMIQAIGIIVIITSLFLISNRLINLLLLSFVLVTLFMIGSILLPAKRNVNDLVAVGVFLVIMIVLNSIAFLQTNYYRRKQYVVSMQLHQLSHTDSLTGIYNRQKFNESFEHEFNRSQRYSSSFSLALIDIDHFKTINDTHGHPQGDRVLTQIATLIQKSLRTTDIFARWGGEEFILLLPETKRSQAAEIANRLRLKVEKLNSASNLQVTCSIGVVESRSQDTIETLLQRVDDQLYTAKQKGRNQIAADW